MTGTDRNHEVAGGCGGGAIPRRGYRLATVSDLSRLLQASKQLVRRMAKAGTLPKPLSLGSGGTQPGQVQRWRPEEIAERLGITVDDVLASIDEREARP